MTDDTVTTQPKSNAVITEQPGFEDSFVDPGGIHVQTESRQNWATFDDDDVLKREEDDRRKREQQNNTRHAQNDPVPSVYLNSTNGKSVFTKSKSSKSRNNTSSNPDPFIDDSGCDIAAVFCCLHCCTCDTHSDNHGDGCCDCDKCCECDGCCDCKGWDCNFCDCDGDCGSCDCGSCDCNCDLS